MKWNKMCKPKQEGGLGIINLNMSNQAAMLKITWEFRFEKSFWAKFMRERFLNSRGYVLAKYITSSTWSGLKPHLTNISEHTRWLLGDGKTRHF